jgi:glycosyltransferase involved in cell wall biosynthesis
MPVKLIIQIPCYNEAETLPSAVGDLPTTLPGIDCIETLVIDDGSSDDTVAVATALGVDHVVRHRRNVGLAQAFQTGLDAALRLGADIVVNTDGDHQYPGRFIYDLVAPIRDGEADIVIGDRQINQIPHFSPLKKVFQRLGSWSVRGVSGTGIPDATSGFRAYSREAALRLNVLTRYSYTLETIIQAGKLGLQVMSVPVTTNSPTRPSRLQRNMWHFIKAQASTIVRIYAFYEPLRTFGLIAAPFILVGIGLWLRFAYNYFILQEQGLGRFLQSLTIGSGLLVLGGLILIFGILADIAGKHRQLTQEALYRLKKLELKERKSAETEVEA